MASHLSLDLRRAGEASVVSVVLDLREAGQRLFEIAGLASEDGLFVEVPPRFARGGD